MDVGIQARFEALTEPYPIADRLPRSCWQTVGSVQRRDRPGKAMFELQRPCHPHRSLPRVDNRGEDIGIGQKTRQPIRSENGRTVNIIG